MTKEVNLKELRLHRTEATPLTRLHVYTIDGSHWRDGDQWDTSAQASFPAAGMVTSGQDDDVRTRRRQLERLTSPAAFSTEQICSLKITVKTPKYPEVMRLLLPFLPEFVSHCI